MSVAMACRQPCCRWPRCTLWNPFPKKVRCSEISRAGGLGTVRRPSQTAAELNRRFRSGDSDGRYFTMILCVLDLHEGRLHLTSAGHPLPLVLRGEQKIPLDDVGGFPIGLMDSADCNDAVLQLESGDRVFLFSDGFLEQTDTTGCEQFGDRRLVPLLVSHSQTPADQLVGRAVDALTEWAGNTGFADDASLVVIEWLKAPAT